MNWLEKRYHVQNDEKDEYFFEKYDQKPMNWLKIYHKEQHQ